MFIFITREESTFDFTSAVQSFFVVRLIFPDCSRSSKRHQHCGQHMQTTGNAIFGAKLVLPLMLISPSSPAWCSTIKFSYCCPCCCHKNMKILLETAQKSRCTCSRELQLGCKPGTQSLQNPAQSAAVILGCTGGCS